MLRHHRGGSTAGEFAESKNEDSETCLVWALRTEKDFRGVRRKASIMAHESRSPNSIIGAQTGRRDELAIATIRTLSIDAVQAANSGHPGTPMALATAFATAAAVEITGGSPRPTGARSG